MINCGFFLSCLTYRETRKLKFLWLIVVIKIKCNFSFFKLRKMLHLK